MSIVHGQQQRISTLILSITELLFFSGFPFGFNAIIHIYKKAGVFTSGCEIYNETTTTLAYNNSNNNINGTQKHISCPSQDSMFTFVFMSWLISPAFLNIAMGVIVDRLGYRIAKLLGIFSFLLSTLLFAFAQFGTSYFLFPAGILAMLNAMILIVVNTQSSRLFPKVTSLLISFCSGAFDSSSIVFSIMSWMLRRKWTNSYQWIFIIYGLIGFTLGLINILFFFPANQEDLFKLVEKKLNKNEEKKENYKEKSELRLMVDEEEKNEEKEQLTEKQLDDVMGKEIIIAAEDNAEEAADVPQEEELLKAMYPTLKSCIQSRFFIFTLLYYGIVFLRFNYFLSSLGTELAQKLEKEEQVGQFLEELNYFLFCGIFAAPIAGFTLDKLRAIQAHKEKARNLVRNVDDSEDCVHWYWQHVLPLAGIFFISILLALVYTILSFIPTTGAIYASFFAFLLFRGFFFSGIYASLVMAFPAMNFGILCGLMNIVGGLSSLLQYALHAACKASSVHVINGFFVVLVSISFLHPLQIFFGTKLPF